MEVPKFSSLTRQWDIWFFLGTQMKQEIRILSLAKFLDAISRWLPPQKRPELEAAIASLNPDKMYVENVRSVLGVSTETAVDACEAAVRQGLFRRRIEIISPDGSIATSASCEEDPRCQSRH